MVELVMGWHPIPDPVGSVTAGLASLSITYATTETTVKRCMALFRLPSDWNCNGRQLTALLSLYCSFCVFNAWIQMFHKGTYVVFHMQGAVTGCSHRQQRWPWNRKKGMITKSFCPCVRASVRPCVRASVRPCGRAAVRPCVHAFLRAGISV